MLLCISNLDQKAFSVLKDRIHRRRKVQKSWGATINGLFISASVLFSIPSQIWGGHGPPDPLASDAPVDHGLVSSNVSDTPSLHLSSVSVMYFVDF